uniref:Glycosyltransferase n=1 Tax=Linum usitatissimum TaxID=4006 RepID=I2BH60_LINUS|nr:UDP-glycosyltransferase 1 [Linum usitatissimum]
MLQFSKRLVPKGIKVTLVLTRFLSKSITSPALNINLATISDGFDDGGTEAAGSSEVWLTTFREVGSETLAQLIQKFSEAGDPVHCVVYNHCIPWCLDVAKRFDLLAAAFLTQSCAVDCVYKLIHEGVVKPPVKEEDGVLRFEGLPPLTAGDLPSLVSDVGSYGAVLDALVGQYENIKDADWVLCNSIYELEPEAANWLSKKVPNFTTIGPTIPSMYLDKQLRDDVDYGFNIFKPINEPIKNWLSTKPNNSVVYVSFGSIATLSPAQMEELYHGLNNSNHYFLWVVRKTEEDKLPQHCISPKGLVVSWCPQMEMLASPVMGCFLTHCGWNSTLEAVSLGVPMVVMPQWADQFTNAKFIRDVWKVGVMVGGDDEGGLVRRGEIERCVKEVMEGEKGEEMRRNCEKFGELVKDAATEGGSSDGNIRRFASSLIRAVKF